VAKQQGDGSQKGNNFHHQQEEETGIDRMVEPGIGRGEHLSGTWEEEEREEDTWGTKDGQEVAKDILGIEGATGRTANLMTMRAMRDMKQRGQPAGRMPYHLMSQYHRKQDEDSLGRRLNGDRRHSLRIYKGEYLD
jgi:hypothetical protein